MDSPHPAYELISERELPEYRSRGILLRHRATGCELYRLVADDPENVFAFVFRTAPRDGTGVAHIVEHTVLCGSERFPVKDPFLAMTRRSLATFMNAFTYPDKTVYPAASAVEADYFNLMDVYGDAVFFPRLTEDSFLQEAHHLELDEAGRLEVKGVVYNEMRGDYSSAESLAGTACSTSLFSPGHPYSFDSGGDPERIPELGYAAFKAFWAERYHPSNCRIYLYGSFDTAKQLAFLDERFLGRFGARRIDTEIPLQPPLADFRRVEVPYPVAEGADSAVSIVVNWLALPVTDGVDALAMETLAEILLGHDGSPLAKALRQSGLGEDLSPQCGLDTGFRQAIFSAGLRGARRGDEAKVEALATDTIADAAARGFSPEELEAALHSIAFANREIRRGAAAFGLRLFNRAARGWLHGAAPEATLSFEGSLAGLRSRLAAEPRYLESLALRLLVENRHRSTVTVYPDEGLLERLGLEREAALEARASTLSAAEKDAIRGRAAALAAAQAEPNRPEDIASLPSLSLADLPRTIDRIPREAARAAGLPVSVHPLFTNGIVYLDLAFPAEGLDRGSQLLLPLLARFVTGAGMRGMPYDEVAALLARSAGGFSAMLNSARMACPGSPRPDGQAGAEPGYRSFAIFRLKALAEKFPAALDLALGLLSGADYSDERRVADLYAELRNDVVSALVPSGHAFALARSGALLSPSLEAEELWRGPSQLGFLLALRGEAAKEGGAAALAAELRSLSGRLVSLSGLRIGLTAEGRDAEAALAALEAALSSGIIPPSPAQGGSESLAGLAAGLPAPARREAFSLSSQVGFAAASCRAARLGEPGYAHDSVLAHYLTTGPLWEEIRVRRGAYHASCSTDGLEGIMGFCSYRDPRPVESLGFFGEALEAAARGVGKAAAEEAVIGTVGHDLKPLLPEERGLTDFRRELYGIGDELRQAKRDALLATGPGEIAAAADRLHSSLGSGTAVLLSRAADVQLMEREMPGTVVTGLPL
ncbi:MAG TPA: insulinase family protein [Spirochaetales bacterium]|nr:insulinase family protein [Spirochaetales bacterium]HRZ63660.1 insulinase family protein [Spirochaetia bacterium]